MVIEFTRSGGFAGLTKGARIDTETLPAAERQRLETMANALPASTGAAPSTGADRYQYTISIMDRGRGRTLRFSDGNIPDEAEPLVDYLTQAMRKEGQSSK
jgi:hypothetical protein